MDVEDREKLSSEEERDAIRSDDEVEGHQLPNEEREATREGDDVEGHAFRGGNEDQLSDA